MILLTRSNAIYSSPRIEKYIYFFESKNIDYLVVGWDRQGQNLSRNNTIYFKRKSGYNVGGITAAINRFRWMLFLFKVLLKYKKKITTIHSFDLDTAFPATLFKVLFNKKVKVIFDVCDWMSATLYNQNKLILIIFDLMEAFAIKHSDEVVICEPERIEQITYKLSKKEIVVPNIPTYTESSFLYKDNKYKFDNNCITLSYVGGFYNERFLLELFNVAKKKSINLLLAGYGDKKIEAAADSLSVLPNVQYFGKVQYQKGLNIMFNSDIIFAAYATTNKNHIYAAPNKYYEAMLLGKPIITNDGTILSKKVVNNNIGYVFNENKNNLDFLISRLDKNDILNKGEAASNMWNNEFKDYINDFLNTDYYKIIK